MSKPAAEMLTFPCGNWEAPGIPSAVDVASNVPLMPPLKALRVIRLLTPGRLLIPKSRDAESKDVEKVTIIGNPVPFEMACPINGGGKKEPEFWYTFSPVELAVLNEARIRLGSVRLVRAAIGISQECRRDCRAPASEDSTY